MDIQRLLPALALAACMAGVSHAAPQGDYAEFATENYATDDWGVYDDDFAWDSDDGWFGDWSVEDDWTGYGDDPYFSDYDYFDQGMYDSYAWDRDLYPDYGYEPDPYGSSLAYDDYGAYDGSYAWGTDDDFEPWQERAHTDWFGYDDAGEEGWFDF